MDTIYDDHHVTNVRLLKNKMTLDFNQPVSQDKKTKFKTCILESPDLKLLKLGSPELERMIIQQNCAVTPTPSTALPYYLKQELEPTEEQEQYAKGFVDALNQLHQSNGQTHESQHPMKNCRINSDHQSQGQPMVNQSSTGGGNTLHVNQGNGGTNATNGPKFVVPPIPSTTVSGQASAPEHYVSVSSCQTNGAHVLINNSRTTALPPYSQAVTSNLYEMRSIKVEPMPSHATQCQSQSQSQSKPMITRSLSPPMTTLDPLSPSQCNTSLARPIDMADQERIKLERKRLRNRIAASKCRRRKLERISKLEEKVKILKGENSELSVVVNKLRDQACSLKQQIMDHVKCGCQLMVPQ